MAEKVKGWWYPYIFIGVLGVVVLVNVIMAYFATSTFNGISTQNAYERGLAYNSVIAQAKHQDDLGWAVNLTVEPKGTGHGVRIQATYRDHDGKGIDDLDVRALVNRPTVTGYDMQVTLASQGNGVYALDQELPLGGQWDVDVAATGKGGLHQLQRRFVIP